MRMILISVLTFLLIACSSVDDKQSVDASIRRFHQLYNDQRHDIIYRNASNQLHSVTTESEFIKFLQNIHFRLGDETSTHEKAWAVNEVAGARVLTLVSSTEFERGRGDEQFSYLLRPGGSVLLGYTVTSARLIDQAGRPR